MKKEIDWFKKPTDEKFNNHLETLQHNGSLSISNEGFIAVETFLYELWKVDENCIDFLKYVNNHEGLWQFDIYNICRDVDSLKEKILAINNLNTCDSGKPEFNVVPIRNIEMKFFLNDGEFLTPKAATYYHIIIEELPHYYPDGEHRWFPHLAKKGWFTEEMFWELIQYAIETFPETDFSRAIWQTAQKFHEISVFENFDFYKRIHELSSKSTYKI